MVQLPNSSGNNPWFAVSMGLLGLIVGYGLAAGMQGGSPLAVRPPQAAVPSAPTDAPPAVAANPAGVDTDAMLGDKSAGVTLIEFTDYQCPFCERFFSQAYPQIKKNFVDTGKVKYVVRDFPLSFHQNAQKAAEATECAGAQGKFWEMHDTLFGKQAEWSNAADPVATFAKYAGDLKLNTSTFSDCVTNGQFADEVQKDLADGSAAGIDGTPGFWVVGSDGKGEQISGAQPYANFAAAIERLL